MTEIQEDKTDIGVRLRWAREQAGLSQGQVAKVLDLHRPTISNLEAGNRRLKADEVAKFAELYDVRDRWILHGDEAVDSEADPRIQLAARELGKLDPTDLDTLLRLVKALRANKE